MKRERERDGKAKEIKGMKEKVHSLLIKALSLY